MNTLQYVASAVGAFLLLVVVYDLVQKKHTILRNFPVIGHLRYFLEAVGPELRQYIVTDNDEERPFSRDDRRWVYSSSKKQNSYFGFGTDNEIDTAANYLVVKHHAFPYPEPQPGEADYDPLHPVPCAKVLGGPRNRKKAFRPDSAFYISAMSYGSLGSTAVQALNTGAGMSGCLHNTGEGGISRHHQHGGSLIWQLGTGYFGCRTAQGAFDLERFKQTVADNDVRAIEIKLSQGAKPGRGGVLPADKITQEVSAIRGVPMGRDCISPPSHSCFRDADSLLDFVEQLADASGLPVGIKSAVGSIDFWTELADLMARGDRGVDFISIDGGEGGTGAAPLVFVDHVALPFKIGFPRVYRIFAERGLADRIVFAGTGKLGMPIPALLAFALGCDMVGIARQAMLSIGCIQAQRCHTGHCPAGVATQNRWLVRGLDPTLKSARFANYVTALRKEVMWLTRAIGAPHPSLVTLEDFEVLDDRFHASTGTALFDYQPGWGLPPEADALVLRSKRP